MQRDRGNVIEGSPARPTEEVATRDRGLSRYISRRVLATVPMLIIVTVLAFGLTALSGDTTARTLGQYATPEQREYFEATFNTDASFVTRYFHWIANAVQGDFGISYVGGRPVLPAVFDAFTNSLALAAFAAFIGTLIALVMGSVMALRKGKPTDRVLTGIALFGLSIPEFAFAIVLVAILSVGFGVLPAVSTPPPGGSVWTDPSILILPSLSLVPITVAYMSRSLRSAMIEVLDHDFIKFARIRGMGKGRIFMRHVLPNAMIPMLPVFALNVAWLIGAVVVVEVVFEYPGLGSLLLSAVNQADIPVLQASVLVLGAVFILVNLISDVLTGVCDPRTGQTELH